VVFDLEVYNRPVRPIH